MPRLRSSEQSLMVPPARFQRFSANHPTEASCYDRVRDLVLDCFFADPFLTNRPVTKWRAFPRLRFFAFVFFPFLPTRVRNGFLAFNTTVNSSQSRSTEGALMMCCPKAMLCRVSPPAMCTGEVGPSSSSGGGGGRFTGMGSFTGVRFAAISITDWYQC